jgi:hypothetical protein
VEFIAVNAVHAPESVITSAVYAEPSSGWQNNSEPESSVEAKMPPRSKWDKIGGISLLMSMSFSAYINLGM